MKRLEGLRKARPWRLLALLPAYLAAMPVAPQEPPGFQDQSQVLGIRVLEGPMAAGRRLAKHATGPVVLVHRGGVPVANARIVMEVLTINGGAYFSVRGSDGHKYRQSRIDSVTGPDGVALSKGFKVRSLNDGSCVSISASHNGETAVVRVWPTKEWFVTGEKARHNRGENFKNGMETAGKVALGILNLAAMFSQSQ